MSTKSCSKCHTEKSVDLFIKNRNICKTCANASKRANVQKLKENMSPDSIMKCTKCGESKIYSLFINGRKTCKECDNKRRKESYTNKKAGLDPNKTKFCTQCLDEKAETDFNACYSICKLCQMVNKTKRHNKLEKEQPHIKTCIKCHLSQSKLEYRIGENVCNTCQKERLYEWRKENPEKFQAICQKSRSKPDYREKQNESKRERYNNNTNENLSLNYRRYLRDYIHHGKTTKNIDKIVGLSQEKMREWLEFNFKSGMTWDNYGTYWNLDHIKPCSCFDLSDKEQLYECFSWKNTFPVYYKENLTKFNKVDEDLIAFAKVQANLFMNSKNQRRLFKQKKLIEAENEKIKFLGHFKFPKTIIGSN